MLAKKKTNPKTKKNKNKKRNKQSLHLQTTPDDHIYQPPPLGQDMTQGQFLSGV